jgi:hypothetical protein
MNCQRCSNLLPSGENFCPNRGAQVPTIAAEPISRIDFSQYIADRTKDFTGRGWVFTELERRPSQNDYNRFLYNMEAFHFDTQTRELKRIEFVVLQGATT